MTSCLLQFVYAPAREMRDCKGNIPLPRGSNRGAQHPCWHTILLAKSSVLYLCFQLARKRGWRRTLRCGRVWRQTLFRGSRTVGFCDGGLRHKRRIFEKQNPTGWKRKQRYIKPRPAAATFRFQRFFRFPLPWVIVVFPRWLMGFFRYLDFLSPLIIETNSSFVSVS